MSEHEWYLSDDDQAAINKVVTRCIVDAMKDVGEAIKEAWSYSSTTDDGKLVARVVPKDDERFWDEAQDVRVVVDLARAVRGLREGDVFADSEEVIEAGLREIEAAIAYVRAP